ncbi:MAG: DUF192 domain-containing protein [Acidimicrobiia bacterium]|nr:DUF192 domain-containing protein [Acidimicrobiia bacterium]
MWSRSASTSETAGAGESARWLWCDGRRLAPVEVAVDRVGRARGLLGRDNLDGALWLAPARSVHTVGMRFTIDTVMCDADLGVLRVLTVPPGCVVLPRRGVRSILETAAGAAARWEIRPGCALAIRRGPAA